MWLQILRGHVFTGFSLAGQRRLAMSCGGSDSSESGDAPCDGEDRRIDAYVKAFAAYPRLKEVLFMQIKIKRFEWFIDSCCSLSFVVSIFQ